MARPLVMSLGCMQGAGQSSRLGGGWSALTLKPVLRVQFTARQQGWRAKGQPTWHIARPCLAAWATHWLAQPT